MTLSVMKIVLTAFLFASLMGSPLFVQQADARSFGGGGYHSGSGFSGGSFRGVDDDRFRGGGGYATGPRGGAVAEGPRGEVAAEEPRVAVRPEGNIVTGGTTGGVTASGVRGREGDGYYDHGNWYPSNVVPNRAAFAAGAAVGLAVGATVASLPDSYATIVVGDQDYYVSDSVYYQPCLVGAVVNYCVVPAPNY